MQQVVERPSEPSPQAANPSLWAIIRRRWWLIALLVGAAAVVALIAGLLARPSYRSSERLQVNILDQQEVTLFTRLPSSGAVDQMSIILTDFGDIVRSSLIAWRTIDDLDLGMSAQDLLKDLEVNIAGEFMTISYEGSTAEQAQQVLSRHVENAIDYYQSLSARPSQSTGQFLAAAMDRQSQAVAAAQSALQQFQLQYNISDLAREANAGQDTLQALLAERSASLVEASRADALAAYWQQAAEDAQARAAAARQQMAAAASTPESDGESAAGGDAQAAAPPVPQIAALEAQIAAHETQAGAYRVTALNQEAAAAGHRAAAKEQDAIISQRKADLAQLISLSNDYDALVSALSNARADYEFLRAKAVEAKLKEQQITEVGPLQVVEPASLPTSPSPSIVLRLVLLAVLVSLLVGLVLVLLLEALQPDPRRS